MSSRVFPIFVASQYFDGGSIFPALEDYTGLEWDTLFIYI